MATRIKEKLLARIPELEANKSGRDIVWAFQKDVGFASNYSAAIKLGKAAKILRGHMIDHEFKCDGRFHKDATPKNHYLSSFA